MSRWWRTCSNSSPCETKKRNSEFMREALRDAVYGTRLSKRALEDLLESERQFEEGETVSAEEARERFGTDE